MPKISIVMPVYNVDNYLCRSIDSVLNQTFTDFELILVDDGSTDNCGKICDDYRLKDSRIKVIHKENGGVSSARNLGLDNVKGEYVCFLDSDDVLHFQYLQIMFISIGSSDMVYCDFEKFTSEFKQDRIEIKTVKTNIFDGDFIYQNPRLSFLCVWNKLVKTQIINNIRFDTNLSNAEDTRFAFELLEMCNNVIYVNSKLYGYYIRTDGAVGSIKYKGRLDIENVWKEIYDKTRNNKYIKKQVKQYLIDSRLGLFYASKNISKVKMDQCRKYLFKNLLNILFDKNRYTVKEKIGLLVNLIK